MKTELEYNDAPVISRRSFLFGMGVTGIGLALGIPSATQAYSQYSALAGNFEPNVWVKIDSDGTTTITVAKAEMGQGVRTSLAMIVAEEMDADWSKVIIRQARPDTGNGSLGTGGSGSVTGSYSTLRKAGATVRSMMISAAAKQWGVAESALTAANGVVSESGGSRTARYGELTDVAATIPIPANPTQKTPANFKLIGTPKAHIDAPDIVRGTAKFGMDIRLPGMKFAVVARPPAFGASVKTFDDTETRKIQGVISVFQIGLGVAVVAENTWSALQGRDALKVEWNMGNNTALNSTEISTRLKNAITTVPNPGGNPAKIVEAQYEVPYLSHAPMEVMNCVADVTSDSCTIYAPTQVADSALSAATSASGVSKVTVYTTLLGGGFGRRLQTDYVTAAVQISKRIQAPVLFMYTRTDDLRSDYYRPASYHVLRGGLDASGKVVGWVHRSANGGTGGLPYSVGTPNSSASSVSLPVPTGAWRSVENTSQVFCNESFMDELAFSAGKDAFEFRRDHLPAGRLKNVLEQVAVKADWYKPLPKGWGRGIACFQGYGSYIGEVVEVSVSDEGTLKVERLVAVVDCGIAVNPMGVEAQIMGAAHDALATALKAEITIKNGAVVQSNWRDFEWIRMSESPKVEVHILPSTSSPGGMGEVGFPAVSGALCNAIFHATGQRIRTLPVAKSFVTSVDNTEQADENSLKIFPNPVDSSFHIEGIMAGNGAILDVKIQNILGTSIWETQEKIGVNGAISTTIDFPTSPAGVYFITLRRGKSSRTLKIAKQ